MYSDNRPCDICGSDVRLTQHRTATYEKSDDTVDERICTNPDCDSNRGGRSPDSPRP